MRVSTARVAAITSEYHTADATLLLLRRPKYPRA